MKINEEALRKAIKKADYTLESFASELDMTRQGLCSVMERDKVKPELLERIGKLLKVDISVVAEPEEEYNIKQKVTTGNIINVPLIAYGGFLQGYSSKVFLDSLERFTMPGVTGEHFAFEVDGMSMYDKAAPGDKAISTLVENVDWMTKGKMYVLQTVDGLLIKLFDKIVGDKAHFHSYNDGYEGLVIPLKNLKRIYFVDWILKKP